MLPPTHDEPFAAKSIGQVSPAAAACSCTASVIAPASHHIDCDSVSISPILRIFDNDNTISPFEATAPPASPVRPPEGTTATPAAEHNFIKRETSSVDCGKQIASGL